VADFSAHRYEYTRGRLSEDQVALSPFDQFAHWLQDAIAEKVVEPTAMCLSTVGPDVRPSSRIVLLRGQDERGFTFFTNYLSRKGIEMEASRAACLNFWWGALERQVRIEGTIEQVSAEESDAYWRDRPYESQIASATSPQSQVIGSREELIELVEQARIQSPESIARPSHWGGYRLIPDYFEFWQGGPARLHDRIVFTKTESGWSIQRLAP
jgi:pyridoxamine 5'-phosphate oxidase